MDEQNVKTLDGETWVPLRDVVEKLREFAQTRDRRSQWPIDQAADFIDREFGGSGVS